MEGFDAEQWHLLPSDLLTPPDFPSPTMEEGQVVEKPKRVRTKKAADGTLKGPGVGVAGKWIVCLYCGNTSEKALVPATVIKGAAFDTFPCGLAWIAANASDAATRDKVSAEYSKLYGQPPGLAIAAPPTKDLMQFGGNLTNEQWLPNATLWQQLTTNCGVTLDGIGSRAKKAKANTGTLTFDVGMHVIPTKGPSKAVNAVDGAPKKKGDLTPIGAQRKITKWANANEGYTVNHFDSDKHSITACVHDDDAGDAGLLNNTATQLAGVKVYGPAIALMARKTALKV